MLGFRCFYCLFIVLTVTQCSSNHSPQITIGAAASTQYAVEALIAHYEKEHEVQIHPIFSSSGKLTAQIEHGAPIDLFIAADTQYTHYLYKHHHTIHQPEIYARGTLVLWSTIANAFLDTALTCFNSNTTAKIALADPQIAPYGQLSKQLLDEHQLYNRLSSRLVLGESIGQVNQYVTSQAVNWGFTAKSVVAAPRLKDKGKYIAFPAYTIDQSMVLIEKEPSPDLIQFYNFLQSNTAKEILQIYGYQIPNAQ